MAGYSIAPFPRSCKKLAQEIFKYISEYDYNDGTLKYQCLGNFALEVLSLPSSNADAENLF